MPRTKDPVSGKFLKMTPATPENTGQAKPGHTKVIGSDNKNGPSMNPAGFAPTAGPMGSDTPQADQARVDADKHLSDLFDKTFGVAPEMAAPGVPAPEAPEPITTTESVSTDQPVAETKDTDSSEDPRMQRAKTALERSGFTSEEIAALSPEDALSRGLKRADTFSTDDDVYRRLNELEKNPKQTSAEADSPAQPAEQPVSLHERLEKLVEPLGEEAVADVEAVLAPMQAELKELRELAQEIRTERQSEGMGLMEQKRQELGERIPGLKDDQEFSRVIARMSRLSKDPEYQRQAGESKADAATRLMEDSALSLRMRQVPVQTEEQRVATRETALKRTAGTPAGSGQTTPATEETPRTHEERVDAGLNALFDGKTPEEARQIAWGS